MKEVLKKDVRYLFILIFVILLYGKSINFSFISDDWINFFDIGKYLQLKDVDKIFSKTQINNYGESPYYRPFDTLYFLLMQRLFGDNALGYHLMSLALLTAFALLFYNFLKRHIDDKNLALLLVIIFLSHPLLVEPVCWLSARNQIILGIAFFSALIALKGYLVEKKWILLPIFFVALISAPLFHETGFMLLPVLFFYLLTLIEGGVKEKKGIVLILIASAIYLALFFVRSKIAPISEEGYSSRTHLLTAPTIVSTYIKNTLFPFGLKVHYYDLSIKEGFDSTVLFSSIHCLIFFSFMIFFSLRDRLVRFGFLFFLFTLLPASGLVVFIKKSLVSDRYAFLPLSGLFIAMGSLLNKIEKKKPLLIALAVITLIFSFGNVIRQDVWRNDLEHALAKVREFPEHVIERVSLATEYIKINRLDRAEEELKIAFKLSKKPEELVYVNYAMLAVMMGNDRLAEDTYLEYLKYDEKGFFTLYNLGTFYLERGEREKAKEYLERALRFARRDSYVYADILNNLGIIAYLENDKGKSKYYFTEALKIRPYDERIRKNAAFLEKN